MKVCAWCETEFQPKPGGYNAKFCNEKCKLQSKRSNYSEAERQRRRASGRARYKRVKRDPGRYEKHLASGRKARAQVRAWLSDYKLKLGCKDCGYKGHSAALQLDHEGPKSGEIAELRSSVKRLQAEIEAGRCVVRCAICHSIRTWAQKNNLDYDAVKNPLACLGTKKVVITDKDGKPYLTRYILQQNPDRSGIYLHIIHQSDDDRALHDHPFDFRSYILSGTYVEHTANGSRRYNAGDWNVKQGPDAHRLELDKGEVITILYRGPKYREWGFITPTGWQHHVAYLDEKFGPGEWGKEEEISWGSEHEVE